MNKLIWTLLLVGIMFCMSFVMMLVPEKMWKLEHLFSVKGGEPTEAYINMTRLSGVVLFLLSIFFGVTLILIIFGKI